MKEVTEAWRNEVRKAVSREGCREGRFGGKERKVEVSIVYGFVAVARKAGQSAMSYAMERAVRSSKPPLNRHVSAVCQF